MRRLLLLISAVVLVDTMLFAALTPLLPYYTDRLGISKTGAGILLGAYPAGALIGSLPAGWFARRHVKLTLLSGLAVLCVSSVAFAFAEDVVLLDLSRFVQGLSSAASWTAGLSWLTRAAPSERRGEMIGTAFSAALGGVLLGPTLGAAASETSPELVFSGVAVLAALLLGGAAIQRAPAPETGAAGGVRDALSSRAVVAGLTVVVLVGIYFGVLEVVIPLRIDELGGTAALIGATFAVGAGIQSVTSPLIGRLSDARGPGLPIRAALAAGACVAALLPLLESEWLLAATVIAAAPLVGALWVPGLALLSSGADSAGVDQAIGFALMNVAWGASQALGASGGGAMADAAGDAVVYLALATMMSAALAASLSRGRAPTAEAPP